MNDFTVWEVVDIVGIYLAFYAFGLCSGIFVMWIENKVSQHGRMGRREHA